MKNFPKSYEKFIDRFLKEIDKQYEIFVNVSGWYTVVTELCWNDKDNCQGANTEVYRFFPPTTKFRLGTERHIDEMRVISFLYYMRDTHPERYKNFRDTVQRMKNGTPFFGELKPGQKFYFGGTLYMFCGSDKDSKSYVIKDVKNYKLIYLNGSSFRRQKVDALYKYFVKDSELNDEVTTQTTFEFETPMDFIHWITHADDKIK